MEDFKKSKNNKDLNGLVSQIAPYKLSGFTKDDQEKINFVEVDKETEKLLIEISSHVKKKLTENGFDSGYGNDQDKRNYLKLLVLPIIKMIAQASSPLTFDKFAESLFNFFMNKHKTISGNQEEILKKATPFLRKKHEENCYYLLLVLIKNLNAHLDTAIKQADANSLTTMFKMLNMLATFPDAEKNINLRSAYSHLNYQKQYGKILKKWSENFINKGDFSSISENAINEMSRHINLLTKAIQDQEREKKSKKTFDGEHRSLQDHLHYSSTQIRKDLEIYLSLAQQHKGCGSQFYQELENAIKAYNAVHQKSQLPEFNAEKGVSKLTPAPQSLFARLFTKSGDKKNKTSSEEGSELVTMNSASSTSSSLTASTTSTPSPSPFGTPGES